MKFLKKAAFLPIYFASRGYVITPTNVRVDISAATWDIPAPFWSRVFPVEKATKVGIIVIEPIIDESVIPKKFELSPIKAEIVLGFSIANINPTIRIILKNWGIMFSNDLIAILIAVFVFFLSFINDKINKSIDIEYKI